MSETDRIHRQNGVSRRQLLAAGAGVAGIAAGAGMVLGPKEALADAAVMPDLARRDTLTLPQIQLSVTGAVQGLFKGDIAKGKASTVWAVDQQLNVPYDTSSGQPSGRRVHSPVVITKPVNVATPQFLEACAQGEDLTSVVIGFYKPDGRGLLMNYFTIKLSDAHVIESRQYVSDTDSDHFAAFGGMKLVEDVAFSYYRIEVDWTSPPVQFVDVWPNVT